MVSTAVKKETVKKCSYAWLQEYAMLYTTGRARLRRTEDPPESTTRLRMGKLRKSGVAPVEWEFLHHDSCPSTWNCNKPWNCNPAGSSEPTIELDECPAVGYRARNVQCQSRPVALK